MNGKKTLRFVEYLFTFAVVITLNFAIPRLMPGGPFTAMFTDLGESASLFGQEQRRHFMEYYGLDRPLLEQYIRYLGALARGNLGFSYYYKEPVLNLILRRLPWTLLIVLLATVLSFFFGIVLGSFSAWRRNTWCDVVLYFFMVVSGTIPSFLIGLFFLFSLAAGLGIFPLSGATSYFVRYESSWDKLADILRHAILPVLTLTLARTSGVYQLVRNSLITVLSREYMVTARAKGLREMRIRYRHALRNAILPLVTRFALQMAGFVGAAIVAENVFAYPGLGRLIREAVFVRDYPILQGVFIVVAFWVLGANIIADMLYCRLDPRTKSHGE
ncbi:MAG: ABC transporter permease [Bacillota bacterium]